MKKGNNSSKGKAAAKKAAASKKTSPDTPIIADPDRYAGLATKTGRIVKEPPFEPSLGIERIRAAVRAVVGKR